MAESRLPASFGGLVVVDKPAGWTSHDVVARCRKVFGLRKVGHAGTLDPDATGVLLVGLGTVTRLLRFLSGLPKSYQGEVVLGVATSTLDASGEVTGRWDMSAVTLEAARAAARPLTGTIAQIPPMVSAVHVGGRRLHELARAGVEVERAPRTVTVTRFDLAGPVASGAEMGPVFAATVDCSTGTYIRSLAADLGTALGGGAHLRNLRRTSVGPYTLADAVALEEISFEAVRPPLDALPGLAIVLVDDDLAAAVGHGKVLNPHELGVAGPGPWAIVATGAGVLRSGPAGVGGREPDPARARGRESGAAGVGGREPDPARARGRESGAAGAGGRASGPAGVGGRESDPAGDGGRASGPAGVGGGQYHAGHLLAVYEACPDGRVKPVVVLAPATVAESVSAMGGSEEATGPSPFAPR